MSVCPLLDNSRGGALNYMQTEKSDKKSLDYLEKQNISVCDDYSLPVDFVKKRPSSFDPCLAERIPDNWASPSPLSEHVAFLESTAPTTTTAPPVNAPAAPTTATQAIQVATTSTNTANQINATPIKALEGYSEPRDTKRSSRSLHRRRSEDCGNFVKSNKKDYFKLYSSDSSAPKSSEDEFDGDLIRTQVPELNSPDSISEDLVKPLPHSLQHKSPKRLSSIQGLSSETGSLLTVTSTATSSKRNPSPYYYSDLLKNKEHAQDQDQEPESKTILDEEEPFQRANLGKYRKSNSLDTPGPEREICTPKRYSITEEGVRIIRCDSPSTTTSDDSDCTECQKRRDWHAKALALVRDSCNIPSFSPNSMPPHRLLGPAVCACAAPDFAEDHDELFRPRSIFYVHPQGVDECADCTLGGGEGTTTTTSSTTFSTTRDSKGVLNEDDEMSGSGGDRGSGRTRQIYETAFDCKIMKSDDDLDEVERLTNHSMLMQINSSANPKMTKTKSNSKLSRLKNIKNSSNQSTQQQQQQQQQQQKQKPPPSKSDGSASTISQEMENLHLNNSNLDNINNANTVSSSQLPLRGYTPSPPSTAPLPVKFPAKHERYFIMNSIKSAPNLPSSQTQNQNSAQHPRLKELRLPVDGSLRPHDVQDSDGSMVECETASYNNSPRPRSVVLESSRVLELKRSHHGKSSSHHNTGRGGRKNYSSTESMATSSSGGSMESLRSSTSEGNRSTTSSESHHSTSLSSHSSDSGPSLSYPLRAPLILHSKLHILSPISDKSSQEPGSETSDINNRNNNSQKVSPDEIISTTTTTATATITTAKLVGAEDTDNAKMNRKRIPQNKNLLVIKAPGDEIQGSDSGISLQSRDDSKSRSAFQHFGFQKVGINISLGDKNKIENNISCLPQDLHDLPFDMPKLRRRKIIPQQDACTSGSATSVDLGELPFDMPKLRRRLRLSQPTSQTTTAVIHNTSTESSGVSQASSSQSFREEKSILGPSMFRQNLTLNLGEAKAPRKFGTLDFGTTRGLNLNVANAGVVDLIDATMPLDRQGWYHGAISRVEAENTLRTLTEGSFLVRNSESTRQDYSLSLKSAKGFLHMRIQRAADTGQYILGQFSRPFDTIPEMIRHFCLNRLPVRGAEHMCLLEPVIAQLL